MFFPADIIVPTANSRDRAPTMAALGPMHYKYNNEKNNRFCAVTRQTNKYLLESHSIRDYITTVHRPDYYSAQGARQIYIILYTVELGQHELFTPAPGICQLDAMQKNSSIVADNSKHVYVMNELRPWSFNRFK